MGRIEQRDVSPIRVVDDGPGKIEQLVLVLWMILCIRPLISSPQVLNIDRERSIRMVENETAVHQLQQIELRFEDMSDSVGKLLRISVRELVLHDSLAGLD